MLYLLIEVTLIRKATQNCRSRSSATEIQNPTFYASVASTPNSTSVTGISRPTALTEISPATHNQNYSQSARLDALVRETKEILEGMITAIAVMELIKSSNFKESVKALLNMEVIQTFLGPDIFTSANNIFQEMTSRAWNLESIPSISIKEGFWDSTSQMAQNNDQLSNHPTTSKPQQDGSQ